MRILPILSLLLTLNSLYATENSPEKAPQESTQDAPKIIRITPQGDNVYQPSEIAIEFDTPMVPLTINDPSKAPPVTISPELKGQWRWINDKTLVFQINSETQPTPGTTYTISVSSEIPSLSGQKLSQDHHHSFTTKNVELSYAEIISWESSGKPVISVTLDTPATKESILNSFVFLGDNEPPVRVTATQNENNPSSWIISPLTDLKENHPYKLVAEPGLMAEKGTEPTKTTLPILAIKTFPEFKLIGVKCKISTGLTPSSQNQSALNADEETENATGEEDGYVLISQEKPQSPLKKCNPMEPVNLIFSAPVLGSNIWKNIKLILKDPEKGDVITPLPETPTETSSIPFAKGGKSIYKRSLPQGLKANHNYVLELTPPNEGLWQRFVNWIKRLFGRSTHNLPIEDEFGRKITAPFSIPFSFDHRSPNIVLPYSAALLEKETDSDIPLYVNNIKSVTFTYDLITAQSDSLQTDLKMTYDIPTVENIQFAIPLKIRELLKGQSGIIRGTLETNPFAQDPQICIFQVSPYSVHAKMGKYNSLIWVMDLSTGQPIPDAHISFYKDNRTSITQPTEGVITATTNEKGIAFLPGVDTLVSPSSGSLGYPSESERYFLRVTKDDNLALMNFSYESELSTYSLTESNSGIGSYITSHYNNIEGWGFTPQGIYRPGDTLHYKIYIREDSLKSPQLPSKEFFESIQLNLLIKDPTNNIVFEQKDIQLNAFGALTGEFPLPKSAPVGYYSFQIDGYERKPDSSSEQTNSSGQSNKVYPTVSLSPMQILVTDFTPAPFKVTIETPLKKIMNDQELTASLHANLHSGGAFTEASATLSALLYPQSFQSNHPLAASFSFDQHLESVSSKESSLLQKQDKTNSSGIYEVTDIVHAPKDLSYGLITLEGSVKDERGKSISGYKNLDYFAGDRLVGLKSTKWIHTVNEEAVLEAIVVDQQGNPVKDSPVSILIERQEIVSAKVKSAGNAYKSDETKEWVKVDEQTITPPSSQDFDGILTVKFTPDKAGDYRLIATVQDDQHRETKSQLRFYVTGENFVLWGEENDYYLPLIPEKKNYAVGDTVDILVKNPYPGAQALITVERGGILDHFTQPLEGTTPIIKIPVKEDYIPGFYVSVTVLSPRSDQKPLELGELDMGKPVLKSGYIDLKVKDPYKQLLVNASADKPTYKPGEKVRLTLESKLPHPSEKTEKMELAVAVLDESVFDLIPGGEHSFDPYDAFYRTHSLQVVNYSLLKSLVGRMKFEKKGANPGGGAGFDIKMRNLFKFVSYWNPSIIPDEAGKATIEFEAPDNLTGWRILAIAVTPDDKFGLGQGHFTVNKETEIRPSLVNQVSEGDTFKAVFTLFNRTDKPRELRVSLQATGEIDPSKSKIASDEKITLDPHKRLNVEIPITAGTLPTSMDEGRIEFTIKAGDAMDSDGLIHSIPVKARRILETTATSDSMLPGTAQIPIDLKESMNPEIGGLTLSLSPTMINQLSGIFTYMRDYPYSCWEQKLSRSLIAASYTPLSKYIDQDVSWPKNEEFVRNILSEAINYQAPNGGMAFFKATNEHVDAFLSAFTATSFHWLKQEGYNVDTMVEKKLLAYLKNLLSQNFDQDSYSPAAVATVRAMILEAMAQQSLLSLDELKRFHPHVTSMGAYGRAALIRAALLVPGGDDLAEELIKEILGLFSETTTQITWAESLPTGSARILDTPLRDTCAVLESFLDYVKKHPDTKLIGDKPAKFVKTVSEARKSKPHWENTQENLHCTRALTKYSQLYEKDKPGMIVTVDPSDTKIHFKDYGDKPQDISIPMATLMDEKSTSITLTETGSGRLYYTARLTYALLNQALSPIQSGFEIRREYSHFSDGKWHLLTNETPLNKGDLIRVTLFVILPGDRTFVVVDDAIPGCFEPVDRKLATTSLMAANQDQAPHAEGSYYHNHQDWVDYGASRWAFYHQELRHDRACFYADYLPKGNYLLSYMAQVIAEGTFTSAPCQVLEMYNPETHGRTGPHEFQVGG